MMALNWKINDWWLTDWMTYLMYSTLMVFSSMGSLVLFQQVERPLWIKRLRQTLFGLCCLIVWSFGFALLVHYNFPTLIQRCLIVKHATENLQEDIIYGLKTNIIFVKAAIENHPYIGMAIIGITGWCWGRLNLHTQKKLPSQLSNDKLCIIT
jgi:hypothetical protein